MSAVELLEMLRHTGLIDGPALARLAAGWAVGLTAEQGTAQLLQAGLVTPYQAEQLLAGRVGRLRIGPYRLLARLGAGGGGTVYKAEHALLGRVVALKVMRRRTGRREARTTAALAHPNIAAARDAGIWRGRLVLALEYADGIDLGRLVRESGPLPIALAVEAARQALLALRHLHERGMVHRDVKPDNLILVRGGDGGPPVVKLLDLGLTREAGAADRTFSGTADFLAPERGSGVPLDVRSDLWSLGCTLFVLLTGQLPFQGDTPAGRMLSHRLDDPTPVRELRPSVPAHVERIITRLMARDPEQRPTDPEAALGLFDEPQVRKPRRRWLVLAAILLGVLAGGAARFASDPDDRPVPVSREARSFVKLEGREEEYPTLEMAVAHAGPGAMVTLHGAGPFRAEGLQVGELVLRAAPGERPVLESGGDGWQPMLSGGTLTLEGLVLRCGEGAGAMVEGTSRLVLRRCVLNCRRDGPAVSLRRGTSVRLERCQIDAAGQALAVEAREGRSAAELLDCDVRVRGRHGAAVVLWGAGRVAVRFDGGTVRAGRVLGLRSPVAAEVSADGSRLQWVKAMATQDGGLVPPGALLWRGGVAAIGLAKASGQP